MATEIDSPIARPSASIEPPMMPPRPNGMTTARIIRQRLPPRASAASFSPGGVCANTSRMTAVAVGVSISATSTPAMNGDAAKIRVAGRGEERHEAQVVGQPAGDAEQVRLQKEEAPDAVDQAGHGGQQVEHGHQRRRASAATRTRSGRGRSAARRAPPAPARWSQRPACRTAARRRPSAWGTAGFQPVVVKNERPFSRKVGSARRRRNSPMRNSTTRVTSPAPLAVSRYTRSARVRWVRIRRGTSAVAIGAAGALIGLVPRQSATGQLAANRQ